MSEMGSKSFSGGRVIVVLHSVFGTGFGNDFLNFGIMHMADAWEKVVFYLVVQPTQKPAYNFVIDSKV
jgi:hypothetical protein